MRQNGESKYGIKITVFLCINNQKGHLFVYNYVTTTQMLEPGGIDHSESSRNNQSELIRNSQCTCLAN